MNSNYEIYCAGQPGQSKQQAYTNDQLMQQWE